MPSVPEEQMIPADMPSVVAAPQQRWSRHQPMATTEAPMMPVGGEHGADQYHRQAQSAHPAHRSIKRVEQRLGDFWSDPICAMK